MSAIEVNNLSRYFGSHVAVNNISFTIPEGSVCGFLGRNGAGKSTTLKMLLGLLAPSKGSSSLLGCDSSCLTNDVIKRIGYVTEGHRLPANMKVSELEKFQKAFYPDTWEQELYNEMLDYFKISKKQKSGKLSNGQRAQVSLALTLAINPELLIMDDPTLGLDPAVRRQFLEAIVHLIMREGRTVLLSSHILEDVQRVADHLLVMDNGILKADCSISEFEEQIKQLNIHFKDQAPEGIAIPGVLNYRLGTHRIETTLLAKDLTELQEWAEQQNATIEEVDLCLEDQFINFTEPAGQRKRLFSWEETA